MDSNNVDSICVAAVIITMLITITQCTMKIAPKHRNPDVNECPIVKEKIPKKVSSIKNYKVIGEINYVATTSCIWRG